MHLIIGTDWPQTRACGHNWNTMKDLMWKMDTTIWDSAKCFEEKWYEVFENHIQPGHQLSDLKIQLDGWKDQDTSPYTKSWNLEKYDMSRHSDRETLTMWRTRLLDFFRDYLRGIRRPKFLFTRCGFNNQPKAVQGISMAMTRNRRTGLEVEPKNRSLTEALLHVQLTRELEKGG